MIGILRIGLLASLLAVASVATGCKGGRDYTRSSRTLLRPSSAPGDARYAEGDSVWIETGPFTPAGPHQALVWLVRVFPRPAGGPYSMDTAGFDTLPEGFKEFLRERQRAIAMAPTSSRELLNVDCKRHLFRRARGNMSPDPSQPWRVPSGAAEDGMIEDICRALEI